MCACAHEVAETWIPCHGCALASGSWQEAGASSWNGGAQNMMSFDMWKYLWGLAGPAQCVELLSNLPMKVYMVPRNGEPAQVIRV